jgi:hypothetical protein
MPLPSWELATGDTATCTQCGSENTVRVFPAALADRTEARAEPALEGESSCYDHPNKRAVAACAQCGRFMCQLCAVSFGSELWCPACVAAGAGAAKAAKIETSRTLYDSATLTLPLASLIVWPFTLLAAPAAVILGAVTWRKPRSLVRRTRWRAVLGILLGLAECAAWVWGILYIVAKSHGVQR